MGLLLAVVFSLGARTAGADAAMQLGEVVGAVAAAFAIAAVVWTILWLLVRRRRGGAWLSWFRELERRGVFEREELPPAALQQRVMAEVVARMQRDGELDLDSG